MSRALTGWLLLAMLLAMVLATPASATTGTPSMYVFIQCPVKPFVLERMLREAMPGVEVSVFGRVVDFKTAIATRPPDAVVALEPMLEVLSLKADWHGLMNGAAHETYVLVSTEASMTREQLASKVVGTVDLVGRERLPQFVATTLGLTRPARVQSVTKLEDLLALLQFQEADVVMLPERELKLLARSRMTLHVLQFEGVRVGLPAVSFAQSPHRATLERLIAQLPGDVKGVLGIATWSGP